MRKRSLSIMIGVMAAILVLGCGDFGEKGISGTGTIIFSSLEGGCWGINLDQGSQYEFDDLPNLFKHDGMRVRLAAQLSKGQASYCSFGERIDIIDIHKL